MSHFDEFKRILTDSVKKFTIVVKQGKKVAIGICCGGHPYVFNFEKY